MLNHLFSGNVFTMADTQESSNCLTTNNSSHIPASQQQLEVMYAVPTKHVELNNRWIVDSEFRRLQELKNIPSGTVALFSRAEQKNWIFGNLTIGLPSLKPLTLRFLGTSAK